MSKIVIKDRKKYLSYLRKINRWYSLELGTVYATVLILILALLYNNFGVNYQLEGSTGRIISNAASLWLTAFSIVLLDRAREMGESKRMIMGDWFNEEVGGVALMRDNEMSLLRNGKISLDFLRLYKDIAAFNFLAVSVLITMLMSGYFFWADYFLFLSILIFISNDFIRYRYIKLSQTFLADTDCIVLEPFESESGLISHKDGIIIINYDSNIKKDNFNTKIARGNSSKAQL